MASGMALYRALASALDWSVDLGGTDGQIIETNSVVDCPIVAIGQLGDPTLPAPPGSYRIKQAALWSLDTIPRSVMLPVYFCYISDPVTGRPILSGVSITDAETQELADLLSVRLALLTHEGELLHIEASRMSRL